MLGFEEEEEYGGIIGEKRFEGMGENEGASEEMRTMSGRRHTPAATEALDVQVAVVPLVRPTQYVRPPLTVACATTAPVETVSARFPMVAGDHGVSVTARLDEKGLNPISSYKLQNSRPLRCFPVLSIPTNEISPTVSRRIVLLLGLLRDPEYIVRPMSKRRDDK
ncbi:hypothetical protein HN873_063287, partial [Arachis hypogaea]